MASKMTADERSRVLDELRMILKPGDTVYLILRSVSRSGMSRVIAPVVFRKTVLGLVPKPLALGQAVARAVGETYLRGRDGIKVTGCGMDMGGYLVRHLSRALGYTDKDRLEYRWL